MMLQRRLVYRAPAVAVPHVLSESMARTPKASARHDWSDWAGLAAFSALAFLLWRRSIEFGLALLPVFCYELLAAISFILRRPLQRGASGVAPRMIAYAHSFLPMVFLEGASRWRPEWLQRVDDPVINLVGIGFWLAGALLAFWPMWHLRKAFSIEPEARLLVTSGPYRFARHPIYTVYLLINAGLWLRHPTPQFAVVLAVWGALLLLRIRYEEQVLAGVFPEYAAYRQRVGAFGPRFAVSTRPREV
jgi:protein-S-isoprenylcysteine O-methyltransferase Ste14